MKRANNRDRGFGQSRGLRPLRDLFGRSWPILPASIVLLGIHGPAVASRSDGAITPLPISAVLITPTLVLPTGGNVGTGTASITITPAGDRMNIVQSSDTAIITWNSFSIGDGATVNFQQPSASSATLNRVTGSDPSSLLGTLSANGRVWLINQAGIMVGPNGRVDVAEFVASTLDTPDSFFLSNKFAFSRMGTSAGAVQNQGRITASAGGGVYLVGSAAENRGLITAPGGEVILAAGETVYIADRGMPGVRLSVTGTAGDVTNLGQIVSDAGKIGLAGALVSNGGVLNASSVTSQGGQIFLQASGHAAVTSGSRIEANASSGGVVSIEGQTVGIDGTVAAVAGIVLVGTGDVVNGTPGDIAIGGAVTGSTLFMRSVGITLNPGAVLTGSSAIGDSVKLDAGSGDFINNSGSANPIKLSGTARSLVYTGNSASAVLGGMTDRPVYGKSFDSYAPAAVVQAGSRILYANAGTPYVVTADNAARNYGDANPALTVGPIAPAGDTITGSAVLSTPATTLSGVGQYPINATQGSLVSDYNLGFTFVPATLTVAPRPLAIGALDRVKIYGNPDPVPAYSATGLVNGDALTGRLSRTAGENAGSYAITQGSLSAGANYAVDYTGNSLVIIPAYLAVRANNQGRAYGDANPTLDYVASGFRFADTSAGVLTGSLATTAGGASNVGAYPITQGSLAANPNYQLLFAGGSLAVAARPLSVAATPQSKVYGDADPALAYTAAGLVNGDTLAGSLARANGENVGSYAIGQGSLSAGSNYAMAFAPNTLAVTPATLAVVANDQARNYGDANPALAYAASGLKFADTAAGVLTGSLATTAGTASNVGTYPITQGSLGANPNYALRFSDGSLAVKARPSSVAAAPATKVYGDADPVLAYAAGALVNGDTLTGALARNGGENVGGYGITQGSLSAGPNYAVGFTGNTLSVTPATLTYVATPASRPAAEFNPVFGGTVTGFRFGQSLADVSTTQPVFASSADLASPPGRYPIEGKGLTLANYRLVQDPANAEALTVGPRRAASANQDPAAVALDGAGQSAPPLRLLAALTTGSAGIRATTAPNLPMRTDPLGSVGGGAGEFGGLASVDDGASQGRKQLLAQSTGGSAASAAGFAPARVLPSCTYLYGRQ